jgi:anti-sigma regulatory factor (Ser/Thr protein kinase)
MKDARELHREPAVRQSGPVELRMPADPDLVSAVRLTASGIASAGKCTIAEIEDVKLAVSEVLLTMIEHGSGQGLSVSLELMDSKFTVCGSTETGTFDHDHPDLALSETVLAEVCAEHSIDVAGSELHIRAVIELRRSDEC